MNAFAKWTIAAAAVLVVAVVGYNLFPSRGGTASEAAASPSVGVAASATPCSRPSAVSPRGWRDCAPRLSRLTRAARKSANVAGESVPGLASRVTSAPAGSPQRRATFASNRAT